MAELDPFGSYMEGRRGAQVIRQGDVDQEGQAAYGRTLQQLYQSQVPGAMPMQGPPMPGQTGFPQQGPQGMPGPQMQPQGQGNPITALIQRLTGGQPQQPPGMPQGQPGQMPQGQPGMTPGQMPQGQPQMQPQGMPQQGGQLDWRSIVQKVSQSNPGAPPAVIAAAVDRFMPLMNQQSQAQWKELSLSLRQQQADTAAQRADTASREADRKTEQGNKRIEQGDARIKQGDERIELGKQAETRRKAEQDLRKERWHNQHLVSMQSLAERARSARTREELAAIRNKISEERQKHMEKLAAFSINTTMTPAQQKEFVNETRQEWERIEQEIVEMQKRIGQPTQQPQAQQQPTTRSAAPVPLEGPTTQQQGPQPGLGQQFQDRWQGDPMQQQEQLPQEIISKLGDGEHRFKNGQVWIIQGGQAKRIK